MLVYTGRLCARPPRTVCFQNALQLSVDGTEGGKNSLPKAAVWPAQRRGPGSKVRGSNRVQLRLPEGLVRCLIYGYGAANLMFRKSEKVRSG